MVCRTQRHTPCTARMVPRLNHHQIMVIRRSRTTHPCVSMCPLSSHSLEVAQAVHMDRPHILVHHQTNPTNHRSHPPTHLPQCHRYRYPHITRTILLLSIKSVTWPSRIV